MAKLSILAGSTSQSVNIFLQSSASTTGGGLSGLVFNTSGLTAYYSFAGTNATSVAISLATLAAVNSAYSSGGFKELDATNMTGSYRLDIPNAALATSKGRSVMIYIQGAANLAPCVLEIELTGVDNQDSVHFGLSALPNTACTTNASLLTSGTGTDQLSVTSGRIDIGKALGTAVTLDANNVLNVSTKYVGGTLQTARDVGASVLLSSGTGTGQISLSSGTVTVGTNNDKTGYSLTQTFPSNFSSLSITSGGGVTLGNGVSHGGSTASLELGSTNGSTKPLYIHASSGIAAVDAVTISGSNGGGGGYDINFAGQLGVLATAFSASFIGNLTGSAGSVAGNIGGLATQAKADVRTSIGMASANLDTQIAGLATPTNITAGTITNATNVTNLTNAPTAGDFTATMKTSLNAATPTIGNVTLAASQPNYAPAKAGDQMNLADGAITEAKITTPAEATGRPTGILAMIRRIFEWGDNKRTRDRTSGVVSLRNAADSANLETQTQSSNTVGSDTTDSQSQGS